MEFTCVGINVGFLRWERNGTGVGTFTGRDSEGTIMHQDPFTFVLDFVENIDGRANMTSTLVGNISSLVSGDRITCADIGDEMAISLNYTLKGKCKSKD